MSGYYNTSDSDDDSEERQDNSGGGLRKQLEAALAREKKYLEALNKDREKTATDLLKGKGIDPAVIQLVPEGTDPVEWVEKNSHLLGAKGTETDDTKVAEPEVEVASDDDPALVAEREALAAMHDAQESGSTATISSDVIERMNKITDEQEFLNFLKENS